MNPYQAPRTQSKTAAEQRRWPFDICRQVGLYLQLLSGIGVAWMLVSWFRSGNLELDLLSLVLLWSAFGLRRQSWAARQAAIVVLSLMVLVSIGLACTAAVLGTDNVELTVGVEIESPRLWQLLLFTAGVLALTGPPLYLLLTRQARRECLYRSPRLQYGDYNSDDSS
ncbi:hypothetical protein NG895_08915 [Aeoliella sp. ICT_H6.2]|uniref:Uncharacterized protein n=1 Tax=Aeoliella straminimaris TaxID=2954799 RepID=A0A9X2F9C0_9BACT|nr:hypothetical protein [Aeoliella straminimaris]MCO6044028.1 hypothetical protein [Aeoliella straminimaris]